MFVEGSLPWKLISTQYRSSPCIQAHIATTAHDNLNQSTPDIDSWAYSLYITVTPSLAVIIMKMILQLVFHHHIMQKLISISLALIQIITAISWKLVQHN